MTRHKNIGYSRGIDYIDVKYVHPLTNERIESTPNTLFNTTSRNQARSHSGFINRAGAMAKSIQMIVLTNGGWSTPAHRFLFALEHEAAALLYITRTVAARSHFKDTPH